MAIYIDREEYPSLQSHFKPDELFSGSYEELMETIHDKMTNRFRELIYKEFNTSTDFIKADSENRSICTQVSKRPKFYGYSNLGYKLYSLEFTIYFIERGRGIFLTLVKEIPVALVENVKGNRYTEYRYHLFSLTFARVLANTITKYRDKIRHNGTLLLNQFPQD
nr:MAG TPA: hypothetical protein [Caudoviricetes sp.]